MNSLFLFCLLVIAISDIKEQIISNRYVLNIVILAIVLAVDKCRTLGGICIGDMAAGALCVSVPLLIVTVITGGAFGGGDIKLAAASGLFLGWKLIVLSAVIAFGVSGLYIFIACIIQKLHRKREIAFGPFLCLGMAVSLFWGEQIINWYQNSPFY